MLHDIKPGVVLCHVTVDGFHVDISLLAAYNEEPFDIYGSLCLWGVLPVSIKTCPEFYLMYFMHASQRNWIFVIVTR